MAEQLKYIVGATPGEVIDWDNDPRIQTRPPQRVEQLLDIPPGRYDKIEAAYDGLSEPNKATFRRAILAPVEVHGHESIARALRQLGYDVDRKQVHLFREKLARGKVSL